MREIFEGIFREGKKLYTANLVPGKKVYGEELVKLKDRTETVEYREWVAERSKLAAAILNGLKEMPIKKGSVILYLGASTGTTPSHASDIVGKEGMIYGIEFAERVFRNLLELSKERKNIAPIMADARKTEEYAWAEKCDAVYCDIAQEDETEIAIRNANEFLKKGGSVFVAVKSQSIDVTKPPQQVYKEEAEKLKKAGFDVLQVIDLEPYEHKHAMIVARK